MGQMSVHEIEPGGDIIKSAGFELPVTAGNVFVSLTPPPGKYRVDINRIAYGTGSPSVANNSSFWVGTSQHVLSSGAILGVPYRYQFFLVLDGANAIEVRANGNGSANIGVSVGMTAVRLS